MEHQASATTDEKYSTAVLQAGSFLRAGLAPFAAARAVDATLLAPKRWEAYAIAGAAFRRLDKLDRAKEMLQLAVQRATPSAKPRLQKELAEIATDQTCAPYIKRAAEAANRHHFNAAAKELATAWETACGTRDEVGLAAAGALLRSGDRTTAERILTALSKSRDSRTLPRGRCVAGALGVGSQSGICRKGFFVRHPCRISTSSLGFGTYPAVICTAAQWLQQT